MNWIEILRSGISTGTVLLIAAIGDAGRKLHTGRSRNDQVATAFRLWLRDEIDAIADLVRDTQTSIVELAARHADAVMPGYTHLQRAQPVMFAHWCLAYFEMLKRDRDRLADARKRVNILPLGSGALAGAGFPVDREAVARELGFEGISANSLDAVSDRDFAVEFTAACSLIMVHLSRLAEDLIIYCSNEFGFVTLSDAVSSGSSLMPQKKNPDVAELIRGKTARVYGDLTAILTLVKGLPMTYNRDLQEDKEPLFDAVDTLHDCLAVFLEMLAHTRFNADRMHLAARGGFSTATDVAEYLVEKGVPFRSAHEIAGGIVAYCIKTKRTLEDLTLGEYQSFYGGFEASILSRIRLENAVNARRHFGGTAQKAVRERIREFEKILDKK